MLVAVLYLVAASNPDEAKEGRSATQQKVSYFGKADPTFRPRGQGWMQQKQPGNRVGANSPNNCQANFYNP